MNETDAIIESLLFASDRPLSAHELRSLIGVADLQQIRDAVERLRQRYDQDEHSFQIIPVAGGYQMCTRPQYSKWVKGLYRTRIRGRLSRAALETLAIIAYKQPIVRADVEALRGVQIDSVLHTLLERNLVTVKGRKNAVGRPLLYGTTDEFLRYFGLNKITDLPNREELQSLTEGLRVSVEKTAERTSERTDEGTGTDHEDTVEQILGPTRGDLPTPGGPVHTEGAGAG
jgi:segregation and condensation protein B